MIRRPVKLPEPSAYSLLDLNTGQVVADIEGPALYETIQDEYLTDPDRVFDLIVLALDEHGRQLDYFPASDLLQRR